jgi:hypothetical protein
MRIRSRVKKLEAKAAEVAEPDDSFDGMLRWTERFRKADPANAALLDEIHEFCMEHAPGWVRDGKSRVHAGLYGLALSGVHCPRSKSPHADRAIELHKRLRRAAIARWREHGDEFPRVRFGLRIWERDGMPKNVTIEEYNATMTELLLGDHPEQVDISHWDWTP